MQFETEGGDEQEDNRITHPVAIDTVCFASPNYLINLVEQNEFLNRRKC
jgi:hypothetical protein